MRVKFGVRVPVGARIGMGLRLGLRLRLGLGLVLEFGFGVGVRVVHILSSDASHNEIVHILKT